MSRALEEEIFRCAEVLSEGSCRSGDQGGTYFGSTMISVELERLRKVTRGGLDHEERRLLAEAVDGSVRVRLRAMRLARAEAARRIPDRALGTVCVETRVRLTDRQLHIDVDLEASVGVSSAARRS
ncbi:MAG TPA: hypothetical protein VHM19_08700 [Polyangiales bacterium]|nr:hypothetical protein [Polyangiales bacterium]